MQASIEDSDAVRLAASCTSFTRDDPCVSASLLVYLDLTIDQDDINTLTHGLDASTANKSSAAHSIQACEG